MNRLEKYKQIRNLKQKYLLSIFLFVMLLVSGMCIADYSTNKLMGEGNGINLFTMKNNNSYMEIIFLNQRLYINTQYINRDIGRLKNEASKLLGRK